MFSQWKPCWLSWNKRNVTMRQKYKESVAIFTNGKIHSVRSKQRPPFLCRKFKWKGGKFWVAIVNNTIKDKICILFSFLFLFFFSRKCSNKNKVTMLISNPIPSEGFAGQNGLLPFSGKLISLSPFFPN